MSSNSGWISLHRKILEHPIFSDPQAFTLWVQLLLRANHKEKKVMVGNKFIEVKRGQLLTGRNKLVEYTGIDRNKIERLLNLFENEAQIEQQKTTKYRLISITNYNQYQDTEHQTSIKRATNEQQTSTNNNVNNENKNIPYQQFADTYNEYFAEVTGNPKVKDTNKLSPARKKAIKARFNFNTNSDKPETRTNQLDYWERYFTYCSTLPFMQIDANRGNGHETWKPNFDFLLTEKTFTKVREGSYE